MPLPLASILAPEKRCHILMSVRLIKSLVKKKSGINIKGGGSIE
jgi:hypothetical protein